MAQHLNNATFHQLLHNTPLENIVPKDQKVITLKKTDSVDHALQTLATNKIHSAPVVDEQNKVLGTVDCLDILLYITKTVKTEVDAVGARKHGQEQVVNILDLSGRDPYVPLDIAAPATLALQFFASGIHYAPILEKDGKLVKYLSQTDILRFLCHEALEGNLKHHSDLLGKRISDLGLGTVKPVVERQASSLLKVAKTLKDKGISAVPIVDENNGDKLWANFSASNLTGVVDHYSALAHSVKDFINTNCPGSIHPVHVTANATLRELLQKFKDHPVHQIWVVSGDNHPMGVVSQTDVMKLVRDAGL